MKKQGPPKSGRTPSQTDEQQPGGRMLAINKEWTQEKINQAIYWSSVTSFSLLIAFEFLNSSSNTIINETSKFQAQFLQYTFVYN